MSDQPQVSTSEPIYKAAGQIGAIVATLLGVVGGAVQLGIVSSEQADTIGTIGAQVTSALPELAGAVTLIVGVVSGVGASVLTAWQARKNTIPADSDAYRITPAVVPRIPGDGVGDHRLAE